MRHFVPGEVLTRCVDINIGRMGVRERIQPSVIHRPYGNTDYLFMLFHDEVIVGVNGEAERCPADSFIVWEPGQVHYYGNREQSWEHSWIHFGGSWTAGIMQRSSLPVNVPYELSSPSLFERYLGAIYAEISMYDRPDTVILRNLLENLTREIQRSRQPQPDTRVPEIFMQVKQFIDTNFDKRIRLEQLAQRTFFSVSHFAAQFRRYFGISAIDYLIGLRMQRAAFLLRDINMNISQVAATVGYEDIHYFSKLFKKHHGVSPRAYRNRISSRAG